jgi:hypothetical protein
MLPLVFVEAHFLDTRSQRLYGDFLIVVGEYWPTNRLMQTRVFANARASRLCFN